MFSRSKQPCHSARCAHVKKSSKNMKARRRPLFMAGGVGALSILALIVNSRMMSRRFLRTNAS